jgi:hypothetical protein
MTLFHISVTPLSTGTILSSGLWGGKIGQMRTSNYAQYMKEEIFEDIRKSRFPQAPSRLGSTFLFPDVTSAHFYRANWMKYNGHIYEVDILSGTPFVVEMDLLNCNGLDYAKIQSNADKYWRQLQHQNSQTLEAILNGQARVQALVAPPSIL